MELGLSGGSAPGLPRIGAIRVLEANGYAPDLIVGTSMGAVIGGLYTTNWGT